MKALQPRLKKYQRFIAKEYLLSLTQNKAYSLAGLRSDLKQKIKHGRFKKIVFSGMGCSAIVAEIVKGFFIDQKIPVQIEVINDYNLAYFLDLKNLKTEQTLFIINSFSGNSIEPLKVYEQLKKVTRNIIFLTAGGRLEKIAKTEKISLLRWQLKNPNETYSLLHAPQFFVILLDIFSELKIIKNNYRPELLKAVRFLKKEFTAKKIKQAQQIAKRLQDREIIFLAAPKWHLILLKLAVMHFNEIALAPAHQNSLHEFTHCEVAIFAAPRAKLAAVILEDNQDDQYTKTKIKNLTKALTAKARQNKNTELIIIKIDQDNFFKNFFSTLLFIQYLSYFLGVAYNLETRELVAKISGKS